MSKRFFKGRNPRKGTTERPNFGGQMDVDPRFKDLDFIQNLASQMAGKKWKDSFGDFNPFEPGGGGGKGGGTNPPPGNGGTTPPPGGTEEYKPQYPGSIDLNDLFTDLFYGSNQNFLNEGNDGKPYGATYWGMLNNLGFGDKMTEWLQKIGYNSGKALTDDQASDWNKQLLDMYLNYIMQLESRNYNEKVTADTRQYELDRLADQRLYDSPTNQLARLMGAGISRNAALQMLGGSGSGSAGVGVTAGIPGTAGSLPSGLNPSESSLNETNRKSAVANTVFNGISAITGLVGLGFSLPQAVAQSKIMRNQQYMSDQQRAAFDASSAAYSIITNAGVPNASEVFGSVQSTVATLGNLAQSGNQAAAAFLSQGGAQKLLSSAPIASPLLSSLYRDERSAKDYDQLTGSAIRQARLNETYTAAMTSKIGAESQLLGTQQDAVSQSIIESTHRVALIDTEIEVQKANGDWIKLQSDLYPGLSKAQIFALDAQGMQSYAQSDLLDQQFELNDAGFPMLKEARILELQDELSKWQTLTSSDMRRARIETWMLDQRNARSAAYLESIYQNAVGDFAQSHPGLFNLSAAFHYSGAGSMVKTAAGAGAALAFKRL